MDSSARKVLQVQFKTLSIGTRFQMVNAVMKAAIPGSLIYKKITETEAEYGNVCYPIRPDWFCEVVQ